jgi:hypothetical protein
LTSTQAKNYPNVISHLAIASASYDKQFLQETRLFDVPASASQTCRDFRRSKVAPGTPSSFSGLLLGSQVR